MRNDVQSASWQHVLTQVSRTFAIPILHLPGELREAVAAAYLACRAIDEIEDHPTLTNNEKTALLSTFARTLETTSAPLRLSRSLPLVTRELPTWFALAPASIRPRIQEMVASMASRMASWSRVSWAISSRADLDRYTYAVAGSIGLLLCDLWCWHDGIASDRDSAVSLGRGLQAVNILRNRDEDRTRGVDFYPEDWQNEDMWLYARGHLDAGWHHIASLPHGIHRQFSVFPLVLAEHALAGVLINRVRVQALEHVVFVEHEDSRNTLLALTRK